MKVFGAGSAWSRRTMMAGLLAGFAFTAVSVQAQDAPAPAAQDQAAEAPAQPPAEDPFKFTTEAAVMSFYVKPDQTSAFENVWGQIRGRLAASDDAALRAHGDSIRVYRLAETTDQGVLYFVIADPVSQNLSYSPSPFLLFEAGLFEDAEARPLYEQLMGSLNGIAPAGAHHAAAPIAPPPAPAAPAADPAAGEAAPAPPAQ
jgi:hypothetical protein